MTRPSGTTPKGLPFPGSIDIHPRTPAALQALAEAIEAKLSALSANVMLDFFRGVLPTPGSTSVSFTVPFTRLAAVTGWIGTIGVDAGGQVVAGVIIPIPSAGNGFGVFYPAPTGSGHPAPPSSLTIHAVGWGPPR